MEGGGESDTSIANVTVALPTYNPDVHSWFQQVETIFLMLRIMSQRIKVANLMQKLPPDVIIRITDALAELPEKKPLRPVVRASNRIDTPLVNPTYRHNREYRSTNLDRPQLPATTIQRYPTTRPNLSLPASNIQLYLFNRTYNATYQLTT